MTDQQKTAIRTTQAAWRKAACTCDGKHDPFWMRCPKAEAAWQYENALAAAGICTW